MEAKHHFLVETCLLTHGLRSVTDEMLLVTVTRVIFSKAPMYPSREKWVLCCRRRSEN